MNDTLKIARGHGEMPMEIDKHNDRCAISNVPDKVNNRELSGEEIRKNLLTGRIVARVPHKVIRNLNLRSFDYDDDYGPSSEKESRNQSKNKSILSIYTLIPEE